MYCWWASQTNFGPSYFVRTLTFFVSYVTKIGNNLWERTKKGFMEKIAKFNYLLYQKLINMPRDIQNEAKFL